MKLILHHYGLDLIKTEHISLEEQKRRSDHWKEIYGKDISIILTEE